jgi:hypothetical protein
VKYFFDQMTAHVTKTDAAILYIRSLLYERMSLRQSFEHLSQDELNKIEGEVWQGIAHLDAAAKTIRRWREAKFQSEYNNDGTPKASS